MLVITHCCTWQQPAVWWNYGLV